VNTWASGFYLEASRRAAKGATQPDEHQKKRIAIRDFRMT